MCIRDRFEELEHVYIEGRRFAIRTVKYQKANLILSLEGVDSVEEAERLSLIHIYYQGDAGTDENDFFRAV